MIEPTRVFDGKRYTLFINTPRRERADAEAKRIRGIGKRLVRVAKSPYGGWDIYTRTRGH